MENHEYMANHFYLNTSRDTVENIIKTLNPHAWLNSFMSKTMQHEFFNSLLIKGNNENDLHQEYSNSNTQAPQRFNADFIDFLIYVFEYRFNAPDNNGILGKDNFLQYFLQNLKCSTLMKIFASSKENQPLLAKIYHLSTILKNNVNQGNLTPEECDVFYYAFYQITEVNIHNDILILNKILILYHTLGLISVIFNNYPFKDTIDSIKFLNQEIKKQLLTVLFYNLQNIPSRINQHSTNDDINFYKQILLEAHGLKSSEQSIKELAYSLNFDKFINLHHPQKQEKYLVYEQAIEKYVSHHNQGPYIIGGMSSEEAKEQENYSQYGKKIQNNKNTSLLLGLEDEDEDEDMSLSMALIKESEIFKRIDISDKIAQDLYVIVKENQTYIAPDCQKNQLNQYFLGIESNTTAQQFLLIKLLHIVCDSRQLVSEYMFEHWKKDNFINNFSNINDLSSVLKEIHHKVASTDPSTTSMDDRNLMNQFNLLTNKLRNTTLSPNETTSIYNPLIQEIQPLETNFQGEGSSHNVTSQNCDKKLKKDDKWSQKILKNPKLLGLCIVAIAAIAYKVFNKSPDAPSMPPKQ